MLMTNQEIERSQADVSAPFYITLGEDDTASYPMGDQIRHLDEAAKYGLAVPRTYILLNDLFQAAMHEGVIQFEDGEVLCDDPKMLYRAINLPAFPKKQLVTLRSAFGSGAAITSHVVPKVDPNDPEAFVAALCEIWGTSLAFDNVRREVLVMETSDAQHVGVAFTETNYEDDYIRYTEGDEEKLVRSEEDEEQTELRRLRQFEKAEREEGINRIDATWEDRLQALLRRVRGLFGEDNWAVEWVDDGNKMWLLEVRGLSTPVARNELFTTGEFKEILPQLPSRYMTSIIEDVSDPLYAWYQQFDSDLPSHRRFIRVFKGRPYINLSLMSETMRTLGLPTNLVTQSSGDEGRTESFKLKRATAKLPQLTQFGLSQFGAADSAKKTAAQIQEMATDPGETFSEVNSTLREVYTALTTEMFNLAQSLNVPLQVLRNRGYLENMSAATRSKNTRLFDDLAPLRQRAQDSEDVRQSLQNGELPEDPEFRRLWTLYMAKYGHRGIYESDIARPRYHEAPEALLTAILNEENGVKRTQPEESAIEDIPRFPWVQARPAANQAKTLIEARETLQHEAMLAFDTIRRRILELAEEATARDQLPERDAIWMLSTDELAMLDVDWHPEREFFEKRQQELEELSAYDMPDTLRHNDNLDNYSADIDTDVERLSGMGLTAGQASGQVWVLQEPSAKLPEGYTPEQTILVARSVDGGWIPTFSKVAGVIVETGNDLSHGSTILRELGIPAVTGVKNATRILTDGDQVSLDGKGGVVRKP